VNDLILGVEACLNGRCKNWTTNLTVQKFPFTLPQNELSLDFQLVHPNQGIGT
jgi:hypothetical protein